MATNIFKPGPPTHNLCVKRARQKEEPFHQIGVGWEDEKGNIRLTLDVGVQLSWRDTEDCKIVLFKRRDDGE